MTKKEAISLFQEKNFVEAYNAFNELVKQNPNDYESLYYKSIIDFSELKNNIEETVKDIKKVCDNKNEFQAAACQLYVLLLDAPGFEEEAFVYGEKAIKLYNSNKCNINLINDVKFIMAKAYFRLYDENKASKGLELINEVIEDLGEDADISMYSTKCDLLILMKEFDEAELTIEKFEKLFGTNATLYYLKQKLYFAKANTIVDKNPEEADDLYNKCLRYLDFCENYDADKILISFTRVQVYSALKNYDMALDILKKLDGLVSEVDLLVEKIKIAECIGSYDDLIDECYEYLSNNKSWKISYSLGYMLFESRKEEKYDDAQKYLLESYNEVKESFILFDIYYYNSLRNRYDLSFDLLCEAVESNCSEIGKCAYFAAICAHELGLDFDICCKYYKIAYDNKFINQIEYLDETTHLLENPKINYSSIRKQLKKNIDLYDAWNIRKRGIRYLYNEDGVKFNPSKAKEFIEKALKLKPEVSCMYATLGRCYEIGYKDFNTAGNNYKLALSKYKENDGCNCAKGYYAHALLNGIGIDKDYDLAKKLIKEAAINNFKKSSNVVIYLYTYFSLKNEEGFDLNFAYDMLMFNYPYYRYELTRYMMLKLVAKRINKYDESIDINIKKCLKFANKSTKKYYKENKDLDVIYPCFNNY